MTTIQDGSQHIQIKDSPKLSGVWFSFQVPVFKAAILWFLVMADIQDGWYPRYVHVEDWHKVNGILFLLKVFILNGRIMVATFVIFNNGFHHNG